MGASDLRSMKGAGDLLRGGVGIYVCDRAGKTEREGQQETEGVQCMCERVCMQLDEKWSVD